MRLPNPRGFILLALLPLLACGKDATKPVATMSDSAASYLNAALDIMQNYSVNRRKLDWPTLRARAVASAGAAQTYAATYPAIRQALVDLGDHHSFFMAPGASLSVVPLLPGASSLGSPSGSRIGGKIGHVLVPEFSGTAAQAAEYAGTLHTLIAGIDTGRVCGWVVDLRGNRGGNMWPMLAGVGPILGEGNAGRFVEWDGTILSTWYYHDGISGLSPGGVIVQVSNAYRLRTAAPAVAVLQDALTASSGEAIDVAFRGRPDARFFGTPTYGVSTANAGFALRDGATIILTTAVDADRNGTIYGDALVPDEVTTSAGALDAGVAWLESRPECN